jgi:ABC-type branched-subunit amino acid transport system substrate-binding protein
VARPGGTLRISRALTVAVAVLLVALIGSALSVPAATAQAAKAKAAEVGITDTQIRIAVIADVDTPVQPGLFKASVDAVQAWAKAVNQQGGVAGRKVVVDFIDSKLNPNATRNAIITACSQDFAMVGGEALFMSNVDDMVACKDAAGNPIGIPDLPGLALDNNEKCSPVTYIVNGDASFCATRTDHPQTYTAQQGDYLYYLKKNEDLHGIWTVPADLAATKNSELPIFQAGVDLGIKKDGAGFYDISASSPQSALTPFVQVIKSNGSTFAYNGSSAGIMVLFRREATLQGVTSVKVWACNQGCYDNNFLQQGGSDVDGTQSVLTTLPFYSEYKQNPSLKALASGVGGISNVNSSSLSSWIASLLFQDAVGKATASGGTLTRQTLFDALKGEHSFNASGIMGPLDVGNHKQPACIVMTQVKNGKWVRTYPTKAGTFDCNKNNLVQVKMDLS